MTQALLLAYLLQMKDLKLREIIDLKSPSKLLLATIISRPATMYWAPTVCQLV